MDWVRPSARHLLLAAFATATLALLVAGLIEARALLATNMHRTTEQEAGREAHLVADLGLAAALSSGRLSARDLRLGAAEYEVARRDSPLTGIVVWNASGTIAFARGSARHEAPARALPPLARAARTTGRTQVSYDADPGVGPTVEAAVPLGLRGLNSVAEFHYSRAGIERNLNRATQHLYYATGAAGLVMYLAILPLLAWLAKRVTPPVDPAHRAIRAELRRAIDRHELELYYQPQVDLSRGTVVGLEGLVRWNRPRRGLLGPAAFLPVAEASSDLLVTLTHEVLDIGVRDCASWNRSGTAIPVAVNIPAAAVLDGSLVPTVARTLARHELTPQMLTLELTEGSLMDQRTDVIEPLKALRALGVSISIDDFGTGHSSLARLRTLPLDELKIDRSFISGITTDDRDLGVARLVFALGSELGLRVVAEGVENEPTMELLVALGCRYIQGFHISRPLREPKLREWLERRAKCGRSAALAQVRGPVASDNQAGASAS